MASGDTAAIDTIDVESALSTKNSEYTTSSSGFAKDQYGEQDEYGEREAGQGHGKGTDV